ncbi:CE295 protein, partial [Formicarius rufipectus]|nr:CE295 protein [Formicarius rufipectus]
VQGIPCDLTSTVSTGSFSTSETLDASPVGIGSSFDGTEHGILGETANSPWSSSLPLTLQQQQQQENLSGASKTLLSEGAMSLCKESQTQHMPQKHTGNLNSYSEDNTPFQALAAELYFPETERLFPDFHHQLFQPLEPSVDLDTSSSSCSQCGISQYSTECSKTSKFSTKSPDMFAFLEVESSGLDVQRSCLPSCLERNGQKNIPSGESITENVT